MVDETSGDHVLVVEEMKVSFTGTRAGLTNAQKETLWALLHELRATAFVHGDCVGADADAHAIALRLGLDVQKRPSNIEHMRARTTGGTDVAEPDDPLKRNRHIVDDGELLIGCPDSRQEKQRSGTWHAMRYAWSGKVLVFVIFPDGGVAAGRTKEGCGPVSSMPEMSIVSPFAKHLPE